MSARTMLAVLDGFGLGDSGPSDATHLAHTPFLDRARRHFPMSRIETSGEAVGLPPGQMGNSEVGHMTMGAGRVIEMDMIRIGNAIARGDLARNATLTDALAALARSGGRLHLVGLVSDGGVHSDMAHLIGLIDFCRSRGIAPQLHAILDGRDTPPRSALEQLARVLPTLEAAGGRVATVIGRYFAMDRDKRWDRIGRAYHAIVCREGRAVRSPREAIESAYALGQGDEFVEPCVVDGGAALCDGDAVLCFNYRADRVREISNALAGARPEDFTGELTRRAVPRLAAYLCLTEYDEGFGLPVLFPNAAPRDGLGEVLAGHGLAQLRIAETEKYAHVTFFFNGGLETPFPGEDRILIPSPRDVATYDLEPEMSAEAVTRALLERLAEKDYSFVLLNFANPDMVGHTGVLDAAVKAVETVDRALERICDAVLAGGGEVLITADHGNCEQMVDPATGGPHTAHTTNPVPLWWITRHAAGRRLRDGGLADLAPTILALLGLPIPAAMTGRNLIEG